MTLFQAAEAANEDDRESAAELRLAEVHHRIGNNLSMLASLVRLHGQEVASRQGAISSEDTRDFLCSISARIEAIGRLHRRLTAGSSDPWFDLAPYLREVCGDLLASVCRPGHPAIVCEIDDGCRVPSEQAIPVCLIVVEVLSNAIKHAHPTGIAGRIILRCRSEACGGLDLTVTDDGVGLPEGFDPDSEGGVGLRLVRLLTAKLGGRCRYESGPLGLSFRLTIGEGSGLRH